MNTTEQQKLIAKYQHKIASLNERIGKLLSKITETTPLTPIQVAKLTKFREQIAMYEHLIAGINLK